MVMMDALIIELLFSAIRAFDQNPSIGAVVITGSEKVQDVLWNSFDLISNFFWTRIQSLITISYFQNIDPILWRKKFDLNLGMWIQGTIKNDNCWDLISRISYLAIKNSLSSFTLKSRPSRPEYFRKTTSLSSLNATKHEHFNLYRSVESRGIS